jgi:hypothetical protein
MPQFLLRVGISCPRNTYTICQYVVRMIYGFDVIRDGIAEQ